MRRTSRGARAGRAPRQGRLALQREKKKEKLSTISIFVSFILWTMVVLSLILNSLMSHVQNSPTSDQLETPSLRNQRSRELLRPPGPKKQPEAVLLEKPPPSKPVIDPKDIKMPSGNFVKSSTTVVTSIYDTSNTQEELERLFKIEDPMVIFTSQEMMPLVAGLRQHALDSTKIVVQELKESPLAKKYSNEFWQDQLKHDKGHHKKDATAYWEIMSKTWFFGLAVSANPFQSSVFFYTDLSGFNNHHADWWKGKTIMQHYEFLPADRILFIAHHEPVPSSNLWMTDRKKEKDYFFHSSSMMAGNAQTIRKYHEAFEKVVQGYVDKKLPIVDDSLVGQSTCMQYPHLCAYVPATQIKGDNSFFALRSVFHKGGEYRIWTPPAAK